MSKPAPHANKVVFRGENKEKELFVFVENHELYQKWKAGDHSIPLTNFIASFQIFDTDNGSHTGLANTSSNGELSNILGTENLEDAVKRILEDGEFVGHGTSSVEKRNKF